VRIAFLIWCSLILTLASAQATIGIEFREEKMALTKNDSAFTAFVFTEVGPFSEGMAWVNAGTLYAYIDTTGHWITTYKFTEARDFKNGYAIVQVDSTNYGLITNKGEWAIEPDYREMREPVDGIVSVNLRGKWGLLNVEGNVIIDAELEEAPIIRSKDFIILKREKYGVVNSKNETVVPFRYDFISRNGELFLNDKRSLIGHP